MTSGTEQEAVDWLLGSTEPAVRNLVHRDLLDRPGPEEPAAVLDGRIVRTLLGGQVADGGFGGHPYNKWGGAYWRLVSLVELGIPPREPRALAALETVLSWLAGAGHLRGVPVIEGLARRCGSQEGNALAAASRLGMADDARVRSMATSLIGWQWPDGGWNCDRRPEAHRSSFHETLPPIWGLHEYAMATGDTDAADAARRGAELLLEHRVFTALASGEPIHAEWMTFHWPPYWHYDVLQALVVLHRLGLTDDPRCAEAIALVERRRQPDGRWHASPRWWRPPGGPRAAEAVDWRIDDAGDQLVTLRALTVLRHTSSVPAGERAISGGDRPRASSSRRSPPGRAMPRVR